MRIFATRVFLLLLLFNYSLTPVKSAGLLLPPPPAATEYYTLAPGGDMTTFIWSKSSHTGTNCSCTPGVCSPFDIPSNTIIYIAHPVTINCDIVIGSNATIIVENGGSLTVTGNGSVTGTGDFQVDAGGVVVVTGDLSLSGTGDVTLNGSVTVGGDLTVSGAATFCGGGSVSVTGVVIGIPDPCFTGFLPIELLYFKGELNNNSVDLKWATATEVNNDYFTIQRSQDAQQWSNLMTVPGAGNSSNTILYSRIDENPILGISYYRLKQTDFNGDFTVSNIVVINNNNGTEADIIPFPNPTPGNEIGLEILGFDEEELTLVVTDLLGKIEYTNTYPIVGNTVQLKLDLCNRLSAGTHFVTGSSVKRTISKKLVIK